MPSSIDFLSVNNRNLDIGFIKVLGFELAFEFISTHKESEKVGIRSCSKACTIG